MQLFDMLTALTLTGIVAILALYLIVVYRKGWLKRDLKTSESYFLCPNSKCRRVFKDPIWLTDLSKKPPESYQACPHCRADLQLSHSLSSAKNVSGLKSSNKTPPSNGDSKPNERTSPVHEENVSERKGILGGIFKTSSAPNISKHPDSKKLHETKPSTQTPPKQAEQSKKQGEMNFSERPRACPHHFGYVKTLPKSTSIPDE